ncbi:oxidoreductase [Aureococcus anophagefferens]|nr:oxidoreductase [Aureococcus anophagefferens]
MANKIGCNLMLALLALLVVGCDAAIVTRRGFALLVVVGCDAAIVTRRDFVGGGAAAAAASRPTAASAAVDARAPPSRAAASPPLAPRAERLAAYEQLLDARRDGLCGAVGVANFGLSGAYNWGSDAAFKALNACCKAHAATKAQVLVRWAVQRGFAPLPRSTAADAAQRLAIAQNAAAGVEDGDFWRGGPLSRAEMKALDALEDHLASGKLGRTDGWTADDVAGPGWDPTTYVDG